MIMFLVSLFVCWVTATVLVVVLGDGIFLRTASGVEEWFLTQDTQSGRYRPWRLASANRNFK